MVTGEHAGVDVGEERVARLERHGGDAVAVGITVVGRSGAVRAAGWALRRDRVAERLGEAGLVGARAEVGELVVAVGVGRREDRLAEGVGDRVRAVVEQVHAHTFEVGLARVLDPVGVVVDPHAVTEAGRPVVARVVGVVGHAGGGVDGDPVGRRVDVGVAAVAAGVLTGRLPAVGRGDLHPVRAGLEATEAVDAAGIGRAVAHHHVVGGVDEPVGSGADEVDVPAAQARLAALLLTVTVGVGPDEVADVPRAGVTGIPLGLVGFEARVVGAGACTGGVGGLAEAELGGVAGCRIGVAVDDVGRVVLLGE